MARLSIRFGAWLNSHDYRPNGPLFHRWLPNGRQDSLSLSSPTNGWKLEFWFERCGYPDPSFIKFDDKRREVDPEVMKRQAVLDAGPVRGELRLVEIDDETLAAVKDDKVGSALYVALGSMARRIIDSELVKLTRLLRVQYGQYWIEQFHPFDSRRYSLGEHFARLSARWSSDDEYWKKFTPNKPELAPIFVRTGSEPYGQLLTHTDWPNLQRFMADGFKPELAASLVARAHELADCGRYRHALIEGVSALEVAIEARLRSYLGKNTILNKSVQSFWDLPLPARLVATGSALTSELQLERALAAIKRRNTIVHEGLESDDEDQSHTQAILDIAAQLLPGPQVKRASPNFGNELRAKVEDWDNGYTGTETAVVQPLRSEGEES